MPVWAQTLVALVGFGIVAFILYTAACDAIGLVESFRHSAVSRQDWIMRTTLGLRVAFSVWMFGWLFWTVATL